jgi:transcriptional regulator with XRE-family HTH domain
MESTMIGGKIANARKRMSISQAQLAERMFISPQAVGKWERGESIPDIITMNRLAEILGVDLNYFSHSPGPDGDPGIKKDNGLVSPKQEKKPAWDMSRGNWLDADFSGLKNLHEKFDSSNMQNCKFVGSELSGLVLNNNNVANCDFSGSSINGSRFQSSNLANNIFKNCSLKDTTCSRSFFAGCDFSGADLTGVEFIEGGFGGNAVVDAVWVRTSFKDTHIGDVIFAGTLEDCYFENCAFTKVTFKNARLLNTFFKNNKRLKQVKFIDCEADRMTYEFLKNGRADVTGIKVLAQ